MAHLFVKNYFLTSWRAIYWRGYGSLILHLNFVHMKPQQPNRFDSCTDTGLVHCLFVCFIPEFTPGMVICPIPQPGISVLSFRHVSHHCWLQLIWLSQNYFCIAFMRAHRMGSVPIATLTTHTTQQLIIRTDTLAVIQLKCKPAREIRVML